MTAPPRIDPGELSGRVARALARGSVPPTVRDLRPLTGGTSSLTYVAEVRDTGVDPVWVVVKVAPPGLAPVRNRDVLRQARALELLDRAPGVAVPAVLGRDEGRPPEVPPFFVMSFVAGSCVEPLHDDGDEVPPPAEVEARSLGAMRMLAALGRVAVEPLGEAPVALADEVDRWARAFATVDPRFQRDGEACAALLLASEPPARATALVHGDFRLGNMLADGPDVTGIIDWEVWTVGDTRLDIAWFLNMVDPSHPGVARKVEGLPSPSELVAEYERHAVAGAADLAWFEGLVRFRQAAMSALIGKHARKAVRPDQRALEIERWVAPLLRSVVDELS